MSGSRLRVIQWTTGNVGRRALRAIVRHPNLELVGVFAHSSDKAGRDTADLCGADENTGVVATTDVDTLLALKPDACSYNPMWPDIDTPCALLDSGANVCSTAGFITGRSMGEEAERRLLAAAERGRSTMSGTGIDPGFANLFALLSTQICDRVEQIRVLESADTSTYDSKHTQESVGFGQRLDALDLLERTRAGSAVFADAVAMMADGLDVELDAITFDANDAAATADNHWDSWSSRKEPWRGSTVAGEVESGTET